MYQEADLQTVQTMKKKRLLVTFLPGAAVAAAGIIVFIFCQLQKQDWGWIVTCACTILGGSCIIFFYGVYLKPVLLYQRHLGNMLAGRKRETTGLLKGIDPQISVIDGLETYAVTVNIGGRDDPEDDRLFYYDALLGGLEMPLGTRVKIESNDRMIADIREA